MANTSFSLVFSIVTGIVKRLSKTARHKKKKHYKIGMLGRSKLNSIGSKLYKAWMNSQISNEDFMTIVNEDKKYVQLKESITMMNSQ